MTRCRGAEAARQRLVHERRLTLQTDHSQSHEGELLLGEVERVVGDGDAVLAGILSCWQISPQDGVVCHVEEGHHTVPGLVIEPHLWRRRAALALTAAVWKPFAALSPDSPE